MKMKKIITVFLSVIMAVSLLGCGKPKTDNDTTAPAVATSEAEDETSSTSAEPVKLTLFVDESWWPYDTWKGAIPEEFNKRCGVDIQVTRAADDKQLPVMVASGDMPDLICSYRYQYMADSNISYALDDLHAKYPEVSFDVDPAYQFVNKVSDGHYYTIGCGYAPSNEYTKYNKILTEGTGFMVRKDIMDKMGLSINKLEDLDTVFAKVHEAYPDMTTCDFNCNHMFGWLMMQMGLKRDGYYNNNGQLEWYLRQDGLLDYYKKVNEWYRNGYITAENFAYQSEDDTKEDCVSGKAFANFGYDNHADNYNTAITANGDKYSFQLITDAISENCKMYDTNCGGRGLYISKSCKNVETAFKTLAYAYGDEGMKLLMWGIDGEDYKLDADGYPTFTYDFQGDNTVLQPRGLKYWGWLVHNGIVTSIAEANSDSQTATARKNLTAYVERDPVIGMIRFETDSDEGNIKAKLDEMIKNQQINIFMAESEEACEAAYNDMIKTAEDIGMKQLEDYGNSKYPELKSQYDKVIAGK